MKKAIGYIRVSTEQQAEEGVSLAAQQAKIEAWCALNDCELANVFVDAGISGKSIDKRLGLQQALEALTKDMVLVVYSLSRMSRSTKDCIEIAEQLKQQGSDLVSLTEKIDTSSAMGEFFFTVIAALGTLERKQIGERTKAALAHKKAIGEKYAPVPFGYKEIEGRLEAVESESKLVADINRQRQAGHTLQSIADTLNTLGITGKQGGKWHPSTIKCILKRVA
jgi:site-specific DNA recombinase